MLRLPRSCATSEGPLRPAEARTASRRGPRSRPQPAESSSCRVDSNTKAHTCSRSMGATPVTCPDPRPRVAPSHCPPDANCSPHQAVDAGSAGWLPGSSSVAIERSAAAAVEATVRAIVGAPGRAASSSSRVATRRSRVAPDEGGNQEVIRSSQRQQSEALGVPYVGGSQEAVRGTPTYRNGAREFLGPAAGGAIKRQSKGSTYRNGAREFLGPAAGGAIVRTGHEAVRAKGRHSLAWRLQEPGAPKAWSAVQAWAATAG